MASGPSPENITALLEEREDPLLQLNGSSEDSPIVTPNDSGNETGTTHHNSQGSYAEADIKVVDGEYTTADPLDNASARLDRRQEAAPPDRVEELAMIRNMIAARHELDDFLARLAAAKVRMGVFVSRASRPQLPILFSLGRYHKTLFLGGLVGHHHQAFFCFIIFLRRLL